MKAIYVYLNFDGNCREAMTFYQQCLGGELSLMTFGDAPFDAPPEAKGRLVHARLTKGGNILLMASDTMNGDSFQPGNNAWLSMMCDSDGEVDSLYRSLSEGGTETMAPSDAFWGARFAMLTDRFGSNWMLTHERAPVG